jgi:hypothetical protein
MPSRALCVALVIVAVMTIGAGGAHAQEEARVGNPGDFEITGAELASEAFGVSTSVTMSGNVDTEGDVTVERVEIPPVEVTSPLSGSGDIDAATPASGQLDPATGVFTMTLDLRMTLDFPLYEADCETSPSPLEVDLTTLQDGGLSGQPYSDVNGTFRLVNGSAQVQGLTGSYECTKFGNVLRLPAHPEFVLTGAFAPVFTPPTPPPPPDPPACSGQRVTVDRNVPVVIDLECTGQVDSYAIVSPPANGSLGSVGPADGRVTYTPAPGYIGPDSFTFRASNSGGQSSPETVAITVDELPPVCEDVVAAVAYEETAEIPLTCSPDTTSLSIVTPPANGTLGAIDEGAGTVPYTPARGFSRGVDSFTYTGSDEGGTSPPAEARLVVGRQAAARFARRKALSRNGDVALRLRCISDDGRCRGKVRLRAGRWVEASAARPATRIGGRSFSIAADRRKRMHLELTRKGRRAVRRNEHIKPLGTIRTRQPDGFERTAVTRVRIIGRSTGR